MLQEKDWEQHFNNKRPTLGKQSQWHPFLNDAEKVYSINELELLGVVWSIDYFRHYLYGKLFTVVIDQRALLSIIKEKTTKTHQSRLTRWTDRLLPFDFKLEHIAGSKMGFVDYISRNPDVKAKPLSKYD